ncbi:MAG: aminotransferase class III, partial [Spirochaetota bacterium]|nr:aminotransferase class III [Spirochaetota bacterium]
DVIVIQGGIIKLPPQNKDFYVKGTPLKTNEAYACMSETMLLGLSGIYENYSFGSVERYKVKKIIELAKLHGFSLGKFKTEKSF